MSFLFFLWFRFIYIVVIFTIMSKLKYFLLEILILSVIVVAQIFCLQNFIWCNICLSLRPQLVLWHSFINVFFCLTIDWVVYYKDRILGSLTSFNVNFKFKSIVLARFVMLKQTFSCDICITYHIQWNLSKPNLLGTSLCFRNRQVFGLYRLN